MQIKSMKCTILKILSIKILQLQHRILSFLEIIDEMQLPFSRKYSPFNIKVV
jgi:hypothetical protein